jgi:hypothetical protein
MTSSLPRSHVRACPSTVMVGEGVSLKGTCEILIDVCLLRYDGHLSTSGHSERASPPQSP